MAPSNELTQATHDRLSAELEDLTTRGRNEIAAALEAARDEVDTDENGDFRAAKSEQSNLEGRIEFLTRTLDAAVIVEPSDDGSVHTGALVELRYDGEDNTETFLYGSIEERHDGVADLTPSSALGTALLGAKAGDTVSFETPDGQSTSVEVVRVSCCLLYTSPSPRDRQKSRMPSSA